jgi:hypothetical protein
MPQRVPFNERAMTEELEARSAFGVEDAEDDAPDMSQVQVPEVGTRFNDARKQKVVRMGKRWSEIHQHVEDGDYTWEEFAASLHPRELARGQLFDSRGGFSGRPPKLVPRAFHDACVRELMKRGKRMYQENYLQAIDAMTSIATDPLVKPTDRLKAAQFVIERLEGKVPERVEISQAAPWQEMINGITAEVAEDAAIASAQDYLERMGTEQQAEPGAGDGE